MSKETKKNEMNWTWLLFSFKGRISRKSFWVFNGIVFFGGLVLASLTEVPDDITKITKPQLMFMVWVFWPSIAVQVKRWHDLDKSAYWILLNFIPFIGPVWAFIENGFIAGTKGENRFGPDPVAEDELT